MSVVSVEVVPGTRTGKQDKDGKRTYAYTLAVVSNNRLEGPAIILASSQVPQRYDGYNLYDEADPAAKCVGRTATETSFIKTPSGDNGILWHVSLEFDSTALQSEENPLDEPVRYSLRWEQADKVVEKDIHGNAIANTVGDLFKDPPYSEQDELPVLVAVKNFPGAAFESLVSLALAYKKSTNSDIFLGAAPGTARLKCIQTGDIQNQNDVEFYRVAFEFAFDADGWQPEILNRGSRAKDSAGNIYELPNKEVRNLKQDGTLVGENEQPYFIPFETLKPMSYFALGVA